MYRENVNSNNKTHGMSYTRFYAIYFGLRTRCTNPNTKQFKDYGGRGIKYFWNSFGDFKQDMHESYKIHVKQFGEKNTTIERIDTNSNYCKANCKWATIKEQANNRRKKLHLLIK